MSTPLLKASFSMWMIWKGERFLKNLLYIFFLLISEDVYVAVHSLQNNTVPVTSLAYTSTLRCSGVDPSYSQAIYTEDRPGVLSQHSLEVNMINKEWIRCLRYGCHLQ